MLVFLDLETTGLIATRHSVLEMAVIITDDKFVEVARFTAVAHWPYAHQLQTDAANERAAVAKLLNVDPYVLNMHTVNGLWAASAASTLTRADVDRLLAEFIEQHCAETGEKRGPQLAGNTISFDRAFMQQHLPQAHALLHYRNLDVTTLNEMAKRFWPKVYANRPTPGSAHRAEADCAESLATARYYAHMLASALSTVDERIAQISGTVGAGYGKAPVGAIDRKLPADPMDRSLTAFLDDPFGEGAQ